MSKKLLESSNHTTRMDQLIAWVYAVIHKYGDGLLHQRPSPNYSRFPGKELANGQAPGWVTPGGRRDAPHGPGRAGAMPAGQPARLGA
jgi:hypothetical protein